MKQDIAKRIKDIRMEKGMTQEELAEKIGVSASFLGHIERGTRIASLETLVKLCQALDTDPNYLLAASTSSITRRFPTDMPEETRKQLAALFYQGYQILKSE